MQNSNEKTPEAAAACALSDILFATSKDSNHVMTTALNVRPVFMTHYVRMDKSVNGIDAMAGVKDFIVNYLRERGAEFSAADIAANPNLPMEKGICGSPIKAAMRQEFTDGSTRYCDQSMKNYLCTFMPSAGILGKYHFPAPVGQDRIKYYLIKK